MIHKSTMPNLVIKNPFGEKAVIVNKISGKQKMKYAFKAVSVIVFSLGYLLLLFLCKSNYGRKCFSSTKINSRHCPKY